MAIINKLYWTLASLLAGGAVYFGAANLTNQPAQDKPRPALEQKIQALGQQVLNEKERKAEREANPEYKSLKTFKGYEDKRYQQHDALIKKYADYWNKEFSQIPGFTPLDANLVKAMMLVESGSPKDLDAWNHDPMQIANKGDYALKVLRGGLENFIPKGGYQELQNIAETPRKNGKWDYSNSNMTPKLSIKYGIRWLFHKAFIFDKTGKPVGMRPWIKAVERYNGGGDPCYTSKVERLLKNE